MMLFEGLFLVILLLFIAPLLIRRVRLLEGASFIWQSLFIWGGLLLCLVLLYHELGLEENEATIFLQQNPQGDFMEEMPPPYESPPAFDNQGTDL